MNLSSAQLLEIGDRFVRLENKADSALVCFSIVNNRYNKDLSSEEKLMCCQAGYGKWYIYFDKIFDYAKAYECLLSTEKILEIEKIDYPELNLGFAVFYHTLAGQSHDINLEEKAFNYCKTGYWAAYENKDYRLLDIFFCNITLVAESLQDIHSLNKEWNAYKKINCYNSFNRDYNILQFETRILKEEKKYDEALVYADQLIDLTKKGNDLRRLDIAYSLKARIFIGQKDYKSAINVLHIVEKIITANDFRDCRLENYDILSKCYQELGDTLISDKYGKKYYLLKDSILNLKQMTNVNKMTFVNEIRKMDNEIEEMKYKHSSQVIFVILSSVFSFILLCFVGLLFYNNRQLKDKNRKLYERNIEMMNSEDLEIKNLVKNVSDNPIIQPESEDIETEDVKEEEEIYESENDTDGERYKNSSLSIEDKQELLAKILNVMENVEEICSISFSAERLAELTGSKYKYVSQVINEKYGCNFNMFLNKFRIKEACRRFSDIDRYGQYTIDAMSQSLGFKSRTTFTSSFKKIIGLTPSQYSKLAKEDKNNAIKNTTLAMNF